MKAKEVLLILLAATLGAPGRGPAQTNDYWQIEAGPLTLAVHVSKTAHLFHVVDQLSAWSEFCHRQYLAYFERLEGGISRADRDLLAQHTVLRKAHGWGGGLEQTLYSPLELEAALAEGVRAGHLTAAEAEIERRVLKHFEPRVERLLSDEAAALHRFKESLPGGQSNLIAFAESASRFASGARITVPVYLIVNPDDSRSGGGYNGGRLTLEVSRNAQPVGLLYHELFHAFLREREGEIKRAASTVSGLDAETLAEGLAYAYSPGLMPASDSDSLALTAASYLAKDGPLKEAYGRFNLYGLALRPLLKEALRDPRQTLTTFLPRATDAWAVLTELDRARGTKKDWSQHDYRKDPTPSVFTFGLYDEVAVNALRQSRPGHLFGRDHVAAEYEKMLTKNAKPGDWIILLLALDDADGRVPKEHSDLLPLPWTEVEARLKRGETVFERGRARELTVFLVGAPTTDSLRQEFRRLAAEKKFSL